MKLKLSEIADKYMAGASVSVDMDGDGKFVQVGSIKQSGLYVIVNNEYRRAATEEYEAKVRGGR